MRHRCLSASDVRPNGSPRPAAHRRLVSRAAAHRHDVLEKWARARPTSWVAESASVEVRQERHSPAWRHGCEAVRGAAASLAAVPDSQERLLLATGRYLGEGFDDPRLDTLFLTMPVSWRGTLVQCAGRLNRLHAAKRYVVIYDYVDENEPVLAKMAARREAGYRGLGYRIADRDELDVRARMLRGLVD